MSSVTPSDSTVAEIRKVVRRVTASPSESALPTAIIDQCINKVYASDFAYGIKIDQMRDVYTFYTQPYIDTYPLDVNYIQGVRAPLYVDGVQGNFFKDRTQFFNLYPRFPTRLTPATGDGVTTQFSFTIPGPFLRNSVTMGSVSTTDSAITISDDGLGALYYRFPNARSIVPPQNTNPGVPGMHNANTGNPGIQNSILVGSVNYVTGAMAIDTALANVIIGDGQSLTVWVAQYQTGKPYSMLFWNNTLTIRPVPKLTHRIEIEVYLTPVQFMQSTESPILNQWSDYLGYLAARRILYMRNDLQGVASIEPELKRLEGQVLERQAVESIGQPTTTLFNSTTQYPYFGLSGGYY